MINRESGSLEQNSHEERNLLETPDSATDSTSEETADDTGQCMTRTMLKQLSLVLLTLQNALLILVMRYTRTRKGDMYFATTAVVLSEGLKVLTSLMILAAQEGTFIKLMCYLRDNIWRQPLDCLKVSVPAFIYTLQNNLLYIALSNLDAATFQVSYQLKILTTALFSVLMLKKKLSPQQWSALVILFVGVALVQFRPEDSKSSKTATTDQRPSVGLFAVILSCFMSGFAGVYFEKILKGTKQSLWLRNVQLGSMSVIIGLITMEIKDGPKIQERGFFFGYDYVVWIVIVFQSLGGLLVAVVVKYADNILKGFATSAAIVLSCIASIYLFDFKLSFPFTTGAFLVIISVYIYSKFVPENSLPQVNVGKEKSPSRLM
ncbi:UDP-N-acetylglucosamine transporter-like isoform X1 [Crassostrea angulata]|uniref:UDP-N-acetylglucosamine transporter-like isoform X1 n=1 Tax=Magallana angulata TaxID=2784310 RepID=UPI0022B1312D|nr:UDP-N-acetylglucosamine transporter-like isoform X1 [Crassostrea angulata]